MKRSAHRLLTLLLIVVAMGAEHLCAQVLFNNDTSYFCAHDRFGDITHSYSGGTEPFDSWGVVSLDSNYFLVVWFNTICGSGHAPMYGYIDFWDGDPTDSTLLLRVTDSVFRDTMYPSENHVTFHIHYDSYSLSATISPLTRSFTLYWTNPDSFGPGSFITNPCASIPYYSLTVNHISTTEAEVHYTPADLYLVVNANGQTHYTTGGTLLLSGLTPNTSYVVTAYPFSGSVPPCCHRKWSFTTLPESHTGCPNVLDLHSNYVRCFHEGIMGIRDYGPEEAYSQHTVHTDPNETDPYTHGLLHTVGPNIPASVRLGNVIPGGSESIIYYLHVDTTQYSMIVLHYAPVLQDPGHAYSLQPRFTMQILDQDDNVIDPVCGAADFRADSSLGWNNTDGTLWKDWTTIGISLSPYHGQDVRLRLATSDCALGAHYGYAYFYVECQQPSVSSEHCGTIETNTLTAPPGFRYLWYYDSPNHPVDTTQSYTYSTAQGTIHCQLSFIENPSCHLTLTTYTSNFWPSAKIDTLYTVDNGCDGYEVHFLNHSTILGDDSLPLPNNPPCESALWVFGDGYISSQYEPTHVYRHPGVYTVTLVAKLAGGECSDTDSVVIVTPDAWAPADQFLGCCDSLLWIDSLWYSRDTVGPTHRVTYPESCDTIYTLHLTTLPSSHYYLPIDTFCFNSRYFWRGHMAPVSPSPSDTLFPMLNDTLVAANGCDSLVHLPLVQLPADPLRIKVDPDCGLGFYLLTAVTEKTLWSWSSSPHDPALDGHENDLQVGVIPDSAITYYLTSYYTDSLFCPTTTAKNLLPPTFPQAELEVTPTVITYDRHTLYAFDHSNKFNRRHWSIVLHGATHDTILLPDTLQRLEYPVPIEYDSVTVILVVGNAFCYDTVFQTLPIVRYALFAPNAFTPDADRNNRFTVVLGAAIEAELTLYNREGLWVYSTKDLQQGWDGTHNGRPCPQGAYVWHLHYRTLDRPSEWNSAVGTVTLLR